MGGLISNWWHAITAWAAGTTITWTDLIIAGIVIAASVVIAILFSRLLSRMMLRLARFSAGDLDDRVISAARGPITGFIILIGVFVAATVPLTLSPAVQDAVNKVAAVIAVVIGGFLITGISGAVLRWLEEYLESSDPDNAGNWALPLARRGVMIVVVAMAGMVSLDILGINISPLIAGLGLGGLAVALACSRH